METRKQLEQRVIEKAMKNEEFRQQLLTSPKETLEREFGFKIPESFSINVLEEDSKTFYLLLPSKINPETADELTEADLEMVSGGWNGGNCIENSLVYVS